MDSKDYMKDFLLKHYDHLSGLLARRDNLRISFLGFYFLFLGAVSGAVAFIAKDNKCPPQDLDTLLRSGILEVLISVSISVGLVTFLEILFIRQHNITCVRTMNQIGEWFDCQGLSRIGNSVTRPFIPRPFTLRSIDIMNSLMVAFLNSLLAGMLTYGIVRNTWDWIGVIALRGLSIHIPAGMQILSSFALSVFIWVAILLIHILALYLIPWYLERDKLRAESESRR